MNNKIILKENSSVMELMPILVEKAGLDKSKAGAVVNALSRSWREDLRSIGPLVEATKTVEGRNRILSTKHFGKKRLEYLMKALEFVEIENPKNTESEPKRVHVGMDKHERGYYKASFHPAEPGWKYVGKVIGEVDILLNIPKGDGYEQKRVILTCNGAERSRCIFMEELIEGIFYPTSHVGFQFHGDCYFRTSICIRDMYDNTEYVYNTKHIVSIKNTRYKLYVRDTDNTEEVEDVH